MGLQCQTGRRPCGHLCRNVGASRASIHLLDRRARVRNLDVSQRSRPMKRDHRSHRFLPYVMVLALVGFLHRPALAEQPAVAEGQKFLRFVEDDEGGGRLEAAIVTYQNEKGQTVHLVSAVHVGERKYFADLAKTFDGYDVLLYEM